MMLQYYWMRGKSTIQRQLAGSAFLISFAWLLSFLLHLGMLNWQSFANSIQNGIHYATDGDTVYVLSGIYIENISFNGKNIMVAGENRNTTIIDGDQAESVVEINGGVDTQNILKKAK